MPHHRLFASFIVALFAMCVAGPAAGQVIITHARALNGNVTPGDTAGYPVTLSRSGSYRLASNLIPGASASSAIHTTAPDITIDLNGFVISAGAAGNTNNAPIGILAGSSRLRVRNGTIGAFSKAGISANAQSYLTLESLHILNGFDGVYNPGGLFLRILDSTVATNRGLGVICHDYCYIKNSVVSNNGGTGIECGDACHVEASVIGGNHGFGVKMEIGIILSSSVVANKERGIVAIYLAMGNTFVFNSGGDLSVNNFFEMHPNACLGC